MLPDTLSEQFVLYLDVLDGGSFSAAARKHPLTPPGGSSPNCAWPVPKRCP